MNLFTSKGMLLYSTILLISSAILFAQNAEPLLYISTDLNNPIQHIGTIIFAPPAENNGGWQATGQVPMSAENEKVTIEGSLLTNGTQNNVIQTPAPKNVSVLGGKGNKMLAPGESTLIGGSGNKTIASQSFIGGGESNVITGNDSPNAVILGGKENTIIGNASIIWGGEKNTISGTQSTTLGNNIHIIGDTSLVAGSGVQLQASQSFVRNDGQTRLSLNQGNLFAVNAQKGMVIRTNDPHPFAALTVSGDVRVQTGWDPTCSSTIAGTMKTVVSVEDEVCSCVCVGTGWQSVLNTEACKDKCWYIYILTL